ncbi:MAG: aldo/keto reductase [Anaerolineae bacterium]|nr:aldo/keto reductase [Anaerolineae bacterium]
MEIVRLGRSGLKVSDICLGTMTFGSGADQAMSFKLMDRFWELGGTFLDTANVYNGGVSEEIVGRWIKERGVRDQVVLATKVYGTTGPGPNERGLSLIHIQQAVEASLRRLQVDVIDLYQIHRWDFDSEPEETLEALNDLVRQGKVRYIGCSNLRAWQLAEYLELARTHSWSHFVSIQPLYSALNRSIENEVLVFAARRGLGVIPYNPLAGGVLTGKYKRGEPLPEDTRLSDSEGYRDRYYTERTFDIVERFVAAAHARGLTPAQLALAWVRAEPRITSPIIGARNLKQLNDTLGRLDYVLTPEDRETIPTVLPGRWVGKDPVYDRGR